MASEETPMQLEDARSEAVQSTAVDDEQQAEEAKNSDNGALEREQTRQMMAQMLGLERIAYSDEDIPTTSAGEADDDAGSDAKAWSKDQHIAMVADALAKELTAFREQNGLQGTSEELAHLNQFLAIDYEMLKPHMRQTN